MWKYILFDLDGTITNSGEGIMNCIRYALEQMGARDTGRTDSAQICRTSVGGWIP